MARTARTMIAASSGRARSRKLTIRPSAGHYDRIIRSALYQAEQALTQLVAARLGPAGGVRLAQLAAAGDDAEETDPSALALIKPVPGNVSLESMLTEIGKLDAVRATGLPDAAELLARTRAALPVLAGRGPYVPRIHLPLRLGAGSKPNSRAVHVFAYGPHGLGLAPDACEAAIWTTLVNAWIHEHAPSYITVARLFACSSAICSRAEATSSSLVFA
jgi:hypothetical protein